MDPLAFRELIIETFARRGYLCRAVRGEELLSICSRILVQLLCHIYDKYEGRVCMEDFGQGGAFLLGSSGALGGAIWKAFARAGVPVAFSYHSDRATGERGRALVDGRLDEPLRVPTLTVFLGSGYRDGASETVVQISCDLR